MYVVVGLGNPGLKYSKTRHNVGFETIDVLAKRCGVKVKKKEHKALTGEAVINGEKTLLVKPMTYMNNSGEAVKAILDYYKVDIEDLIVISDDLSLDVGVLRLRAKGSAGGHNGLKSIISHLGTEEFARLKIGIGKVPEGWDTISFVLGRFDKEDKGLVKKSCEVGALAIENAISEGIEKTMSKYNGAI